MSRMQRFLKLKQCPEKKFERQLSCHKGGVGSATNESNREQRESIESLTTGFSTATAKTNPNSDKNMKIFINLSKVIGSKLL